MSYNLHSKTFITLICLLLSFFAVNNICFAQIQIGNDISSFDYSQPKDYEIGGVTVSGTQYLDQNVLIMLSGLQVGDTIKVPGDKITDAIRKLWDQGLFEDVSITSTQVLGNKIFLNIDLKERARVSRFAFSGAKKSEVDEIRKIINLTRGDVATDHLITKTKTLIENYYFDKGYLNSQIDITTTPDTSRANYVNFNINIDKNAKVRIAEIVIEGNDELNDAGVKMAMKETKEKGYLNPLDPQGPLVVNTLWDVVRLKHNSALKRIEDYFVDNFKPRVFKSSKYLESNFEKDKVAIIDKYNKKGYRDAYIVSDSIYRIDNKNIGMKIVVNEGNKYYFRNIKWVGNTKYDDNTLNTILGIKAGDVYNKELLNTNLTFNNNGLDVSSVYMDDGYLFFQIDPVEVLIENDSIDLEIRIREGQQARISNISLKGNSKTNDHVAIREMYSRPGQLFSRNDIIRTTRELANLQFFNAETINPNVVPNMQDGTVDIEYQVEEASADQIELSAGYGYQRLILSLGLSFNNFSLRNMFKKEAWKPIPGGDGQKLSFKVQTYGSNYIYYGASFTEPWLGGKKPTSLTGSIYRTISSFVTDTVSGDRRTFKRIGLAAGIGKRLSWPDDFFTIYHGINFIRYDLENYTNLLSFGDGNGTFYLLSYQMILGRNSVSQPIYPRSGSELNLSAELTPPYSLINHRNYSTMNENQKYKWVEMYKIKFKVAWYSELYDKLVLMTRLRFGYLGAYNSEIGITPFHRFYLGGDGLSTSYDIDSREIIGMRGYGNEVLTPYYSSNDDHGGNIFTKYTFELRYPLSLNPQATIYTHAFLEAGNCWYGFNTFNPFEVKRAAGLGMRIYLPMFGLLGLDWGYGFDDVPGVSGGNKSQFHFSINSSID